MKIESIPNIVSVYSELKQRFSDRANKMVLADSILVNNADGTITKIPQKACAEEIFVLKTFRRLGIPTVDILDLGFIPTSQGEFPFYTMSILAETENVLSQGVRCLNHNYYSFLAQVLDRCKTFQISGLGRIHMAGAGVVGEHPDSHAFFNNLLDLVATRNYWDSKIIEVLRGQVSSQPDTHYGFLVHNDLLNNILTSKDSKRFFLIDPQTAVSSANEYWDLCSYILYANSYSFTPGLTEFLKSRHIPHWEQFIFTAKSMCLERISFYSRYDASRIPAMMLYYEHLNRGNIYSGEGNIILTSRDFLT